MTREKDRLPRWREELTVKGKRTSLDDTACGVARSLDQVGDWWSLLIVRDAFAGRKRFCEFERGLGLAKNILATRLKKLVEDGIFDLVPASDGSAYKEYVLTAKGEGLHVVIAALSQWGNAHCFGPGEQPIELMDRRDGTPLAPLELRSATGRVVGPRDFGIRVTGEHAGETCSHAPEDSE
jgi:DNA-binding HxlR family transcriptional regulator